MRKPKLNLTGERFGTITVLGKGLKPRYWQCKCECKRLFQANGSRLKAGVVKCTCQQNNLHGHARRGRNSPEYQSWRAMKARCRYDKNYEDVQLDPRWECFQNFLADMGQRHSGYSLDRMNPFFGYTRENCRWAPQDVQARNKRGSKLLRYDWAIDSPIGKRFGGALASVAEWAWYLRRMTNNQSWTTERLIDTLRVLSLDQILRAASPWGQTPEEFAMMAGREFSVLWADYFKAAYLQAA